MCSVSTDEIGQLGDASTTGDRLVELKKKCEEKRQQSLEACGGLVQDRHTDSDIGKQLQADVKECDDMEYRQRSAEVERELAQVKRELVDLRNIARPPTRDRFRSTSTRRWGIAESMQSTAESRLTTIRATVRTLYIEAELLRETRYRNLVINAFGHAPGARGVGRCGKREAVIEVADTGCGIPSERLATIFEDFATTKRRGLGLGLAISKKTVEQLGGTIEVTSEIGLGTTFTLRFPLTKSRPSQLAAV